MFEDITQVEQWIYASYVDALPHIRDTLDERVRRPELTRHLLDALGSPDETAYNVVVTGSKGKGSTSVILAQLLQAHGYRVGLFTGPHLLRFTERIRVNGVEICDERLNKLANHVKQAAAPFIDKLDKHEYFSPVGLLTAIASLYFREQRTDVNIWECGRGALYDDVNQVKHETAIITPIFSEHLTQLGPHVENIVQHKFGVVTNDVRQLYIGRQTPEIERHIVCDAVDWNLRKVARLGVDFDVNDVCSDISGTSFSVSLSHTTCSALYLPLCGAFQADNAALALAATEGLLPLLKEIRPNALVLPNMCEQTVRTSLRQLTWPGRLSIMSRNPLIVIDGAIHETSAMHVAELLRKSGAKTGILIISLPSNRDYESILRLLAPLARKIIWTEAIRTDERAPVDPLAVARQWVPHVKYMNNPHQAFVSGLTDLEAGEWLTVVGTQTLVGKAIEFFNKQKEWDEWAIRALKN